MLQLIQVNDSNTTTNTVQCYFPSTQIVNEAEIMLHSVPILKPNSAPNTARLKYDGTHRHDGHLNHKWSQSQSWTTGGI